MEALMPGRPDPLRPGRPPNVVNPDSSAKARLGATLRALRLAASMTGRQLAELSQCSETRVSEVENGKGSPPSLPLVTRWDAIFKASPGYEAGTLVRLFWLAQEEQVAERHGKQQHRRQLFLDRLDSPAAPSAALGAGAIS